MKRVLCVVIALSFVAVASGCGVKAGYFFYSVAHPMKPTPMMLPDGERTLSYSFSIGSAKQPETVLFFFPGSGCTSHKYFLKKYLQALSGEIQVYALQKRFVRHCTTGLFGCPDGFDKRNYFSQWVADHEWYINKVLASLPYQPRRVLLLGVSEGAYVAATVAARNPSITHLAMIGHGGMQQVDELRLLIKKQHPSTDFDAEWAKVLAEPDNTHKRLFGQTYKYWTGQAFIDPLVSLLPMRIPVMVGFGEEDQSVPVESVRLLERRFREAGKANLTLLVYPGADHVLMGRDGIDYRQSFLRALSVWLLQ